MPSRCATHAAKLVNMGYTCVSAGLSWNAQTSKKKVTYSFNWQKAKLHNCLEEFVSDSCNALAIVTGEPSDLIVLDVDQVKEAEQGNVLDGAEVMQLLIAKHGLPPQVPVARTGSGGTHYYFSLSQSMTHGLFNTQNRSKVLVGGKPSTIDVRADGGNVFAEPTTYQAGGEQRTYAFTTPLCPTEELLVMPPWLIDILNSDKGGSSSTTVSRKRSHEVAARSDHDNTFYERVRPAVERFMENTIERCYIRPNGFDFSLVDKSVLCKCENLHLSNHYRCRQVFTDCFTIRNFSRKCRTFLFDYEKHPIVRKIIEAPCTDNVYCDMLQSVELYDGKELQVTGDKKSFYQFDGNHWKMIDDTSVQQALRLLAYDALEMLTAALASQQQWNQEHKVKDETLRVHLKQLNLGKSFVQRAGNIAAITTSAKQLWWNQALASKLDTNRDLLGVPGGVIDLCTGQLRHGKQEDYVSRVLATEYKGLDHPTPDIDAFIWSLFEDRDIVQYVQTVLGYAITGRVSEQMWLIAHGVGSNGKGVLQRCLQRLLGDYYCVMSPDCLIKRGRAEAKNAPRPYLADLEGKRLAICDELPEDSVLDEEMIKRATGDSTIEARYLHANSVKFDPTHFSVLLCNHKPKINIDDEAMLRRLLFLPFEFRFKRAHDIDPEDPTHRPLDATLSDKLATQDCQEQLLVWLVRGAVRWYRDGLGKAPARMQTALQAYLDENDVLAQFLQEYCDVDPTAEVLVADFRAAVAATLQGFQTATLKRKMQAKGFQYCKTRRTGQQQYIIRGINFKTS